MSRRHASYPILTSQSNTKLHWCFKLRSKHLYKTICWLLVINISEFSDFTCWSFLQTGALKPLEHKLKPDKRKKKKKNGIFSTCSNFQPSDMVETICVSSSSWHCSTRYTCFTGPWGTRQEHTHTKQHQWSEHTNKKKKLFLVVLVPVWWTNIFYSRSSDLLPSFWSVFCTWDVRFSLSRILSLTSRTRDAML